MLEEALVSCPYCGEAISLLVDCSVGNQSYIEDCSVCCQPMRVHVEADSGELLAVSVENEGG